MTWSNGDKYRLECYDEVSHVVGSSMQRGNWKQFWIKYSGRKFPKKCQILNCGGDAEVGAHVYVKYKQQSFILPTCYKCNKDPFQQYGKGWVSTKSNSMVVRIERHANTYE